MTGGKQRLKLLVALFLLPVSWYYAWLIGSRTGSALRPGMTNDFYQCWNASRAILHHIDPYGPEITLQNQIVLYGAPASVVGIDNVQVFPYPIQGAFLFLPSGFVTFHTTDQVVFWLFVAIVPLSIAWLRGAWDRLTLLYSILALGSYPLIAALQMRQPTILFFGLAVACFALLRSGHLVLAGIAASFAIAKPQVALTVLLPILVWSLGEWRERRQFVFSFAASSAVLLAVAAITVPSWLPHWLQAMHAYSQYVKPSLLVEFVGDKLGVVISAFLLVCLIGMLWLHRHRDLRYQLALSATIFYMITPFVMWNSVMLLIPAVWIADNSSFIENCGTWHQLGLRIVRTAFAALWLSPLLGAILLHTTNLDKLGWGLPVAMVVPVLLSMLTLMILQSVTVDANVRMGARRPAI